MIAVTKPRPRQGRRATIAGLVLGALATGGALATAEPAAASASGRDMGVRIGAAPIAPAHTPAATGQLGVAATAREGAAAAGLVWIDVYSKVAGARVRAIPINGKVLRLIPYHGRAWALCRIPANDGYDWTWVNYAGAKGWVRNDLIEAVQYTGPGAPPYRPVPRC